MDIIREILYEHLLVIVSFAFFAIMAIIVMLYIHNKKVKRYTIWKKETIHLWVYKSEREFSYDELLQALYDENLKLEQENKILNKQVADANFKTKFILFITLIALIFVKSKKNKINSNSENSLQLCDDHPIDMDDDNIDNLESIDNNEII